MQHKWGTSVVHKVTLTCFLDILGIVHLMYGYIHESSEIKFLLNNVQPSKWPLSLKTITDS